jgi:hypothetical protein
MNYHHFRFGVGVQAFPSPDFRFASSPRLDFGSASTPGAGSSRGSVYAGGHQGKMLSIMQLKNRKKKKSQVMNYHHFRFGVGVQAFPSPDFAYHLSQETITDVGTGHTVTFLGKFCIVWALVYKSNSVSSTDICDCFLG